VKVHILDDWFDTLRSLPCFDKLAEHDVTVWTDHEPDPAKLAERVRDAECLVLFRERSKVGADLLNRLDALKLISQRSVYPHVDVPACTAKGVLLCSNMHAGAPSYAAAEMTLALMLAHYRQIPEQVASLKAGQWQMGVGRTLRRRTLGLYGYGRIAGAVATYAKALGMNVQWWGSDVGRARRCRWRNRAGKPRSLFRHVRHRQSSRAVEAGDARVDHCAGFGGHATARAAGQYFAFRIDCARCA